MVPTRVLHALPNIMMSNIHLAQLPFVFVPALAFLHLMKSGKAPSWLLNYTLQSAQQWSLFSIMYHHRAFSQHGETSIFVLSHTPFVPLE